MIKLKGITKTEQAESVLDLLDTHETKFPAMTYEQGVEIALQWMLGEVTDDEFSESL